MPTNGSSTTSFGHGSPPHLPEKTRESSELFMCVQCIIVLETTTNDRLKRVPKADAGRRE